MNDDGGDLYKRVQISETLRARILEGTYAPGAQLPSIHALQEEFEVGNNTARAALRMLTAQGLAVARKGHGTYVADAASAYPFDHLTQTRRPRDARRLAPTSVATSEAVEPGADTTETRELPPENAAVALDAAPEQEITAHTGTIADDHGVVALRTIYTTDAGPIPEPTEVTTQTYARPLNRDEAAQLHAPPGVVALVHDETAYRHGRATAFTTTVYRSDAISLTDHYTPHPAHT